MQSLNVYGKFTPKITQLSCDRLGILNVAAEITVPTGIDEMGNNLKRFATLHAAPVIGINIPAVGLQTPKFQDGQIVFCYLYEGFNGDLTTSEVVCELEGLENQEPIETHPNITQLVKMFGGTVQSDGHIVWPLVAPKGIDGLPGPDGKIRNPMAGVEDFISVGGVWRRNYISKDIPVQNIQRDGFIDTPKGAEGQQPPSYPSPINWLKMPTRARWRGNCYEINEAWLRSGRNGWVKPMYTAPAGGASGGGSGGGSSGLNTGSL